MISAHARELALIAGLALTACQAKLQAEISLPPVPSCDTHITVWVETLPGATLHLEEQTVPVGGSGRAGLHLPYFRYAAGAHTLTLRMQRGSEQRSLPLAFTVPKRAVMLTARPYLGPRFGSWVGDLAVVPAVTASGRATRVAFPVDEAGVTELALAGCGLEAVTLAGRQVPSRADGFAYRHDQLPLLMAGAPQRELNLDFKVENQDGAAATVQLRGRFSYDVARHVAWRLGRVDREPLPTASSVSERPRSIAVIKSSGLDNSLMSTPPGKVHLVVRLSETFAKAGRCGPYVTKEMRGLGHLPGVGQFAMRLRRQVTAVVIAAKDGKTTALRRFLGPLPSCPRKTTGIGGGAFALPRNVIGASPDAQVALWLRSLR